MAPIPLANVYACIGIVNSGANPANKWRLTQDIYSPTTPTSSDAIFTDLADYWSALIWDTDTLEEIRVYNWVLGTQPYPNGLPLFVIPFNTGGSASGDWIHTPSTTPYCGNDVVLRIDKEHLGIGKPGRTFARNLLRITDIEASDDGPWTLVPLTPFSQGRLNAILSSTGWENHFSGGASAQ